MTKNLLITKPDLGKEVLPLNKTDYLTKTKEILDYYTKFRKIDGDWFKVTLKLENKLNRLLRIIKNQLPHSSFEYLFALGSLLGVLYGLPKIHNQNCLIRLILWATGTCNYNSAKFLISLFWHL